MNTQNYIHLLKQFNEYESTVHRLIQSMMTSFNAQELLQDREAQQRVIDHLSHAYPFIELMYSLNPQGIQLMDSVYSPTVSYPQYRSLGKGSDRSNRPYVIVARDQIDKIVITPPYLSNATHELAISGVQHLVNKENEDIGYLILNFNLQRLVSYLNGDGMRSKFHPWFKSIYALIGGMLVFVSILLLSTAAKSLLAMFQDDVNIATSSFGVVIIITLAMSIFDLGKTILEEEVLVNKDIHSHDTTRRTISRFMTAIIIAVSIESLLLMFKSLLHTGSNGDQLTHAVLMLLSSVAMMGGLGAYLWLSRENNKLTNTG